MRDYLDLYEQDDSGVTSVRDGGLGMSPEEARSVPATKKKKKAPRPVRLSPARRETAEPNIGYYETKNP